jgi:glycosyltransferase involved in cell wall biosynthesis
MEQQPLVSVLMTAYNREKYIAEAIESVLAQTYENWELLIVDDRSMDKTVDIIKGYQGKDKRISLYINEENLGQFANRNKAASLAKGEFLKYLDSDDVLYATSLGKMVNAMLLYPSAGWGTERVADTLNNSVLKKVQLPFLINPETAYRAHFEEGGFLYTGPSAIIMKKSAFDYIGGFRTDLGINADIDLDLKLGGFFNTVIIDEHLVYWRKHDSQVDNLQSDRLKMLREKFYIHKISLLNHAIDVDKRIRQRYLFAQKLLLCKNLFKFSIEKKEFRSLIETLKNQQINLLYCFFILFPVKWTVKLFYDSSLFLFKKKS